MPDNVTIKVTKVFAGSPAEKAQVQTDDVVTHIDNEPVKGQTLKQVSERVRGAANTKVVFTLLRKGQDRPFDLTITREVFYSSLPRQDRQNEGRRHPLEPHCPRVRSMKCASA